jgi:U3 small nucleolar RNA-associated protein 13
LAVTVSSKGRFIASVSKDRTVNVYRLSYDSEDGTRLASTKRIGCGKGHTEIVGAVAFGHRPMQSGSMPILLTGSLDKTIKAWDMRSMLMSLEEEEEESDQNDDDKTEENGTVHELQVRTSALAHDMDINSMAVSPNDKMAATASQDKTIKLWSMETLRDEEEIRLVSVLRGHKRGVWDLAFSPVDRMLASASGDGTVRLWSLNPEMRETPCVRTFEGHTASVLRVQFVNAGLQVMSCGADGLVKLWTLRGTGTECVNTFDRHRDKVWAMAARPWVGIEDSTGGSSSGGGKSKSKSNGEAEAEAEPSVQTQLVTGGGDSILNVWVDCTLEEDMDEIRDKELMLLKEQELSNLVHLKKYGRAIKLALELDFPLKLRTILEELLLGEAPKAKVSLRGIDLATRNKYKGEEGERMVRNVIVTLSEVHLAQCLKYISVWNTNARHALLAQWLLYIVVSSKSNEEILRAIKSSPTPTDVLVSGLIAYTDRHSVRMDRLIEDSYLLDYTLSSMKMLFEIENDGGVQETSAMLMNLVSSSEDDDDDDDDDDSDNEQGSDDGASLMKIVEVENEDSEEEDEAAVAKPPITKNNKRSRSGASSAAPATRRRRKATK